MSANDFASVITDMIAQDMMTHFKDLMKRVLFSFTSELSKTHKISVEEVICIWNKALPHLAYEVHMPVQETKVSPSSDDEEAGCQFVLTRGKNKGETCGKKNVKGSHFCTTHNKKSDEPKKETEKETEKENKEENDKIEKVENDKYENKEEKSCECKYILTRGKNKGEKCGKKTVKDAHYCATHNKKEESDSEGEKEEKEEKKQRKRKDKQEEKVEKVEDMVEEVMEEKVEKVDDKVEEVIEKKQDKVKNKKQDDTAEKAKQLEQKINEQKQKDENDLKLKQIEEKKNIGVDMAKNILQNLEKREEPVSISVMETQTQNAEEDEDEDSFTYEQCKKQILINPKLNEEGELEFSMTKKNLEKFINKKVSSSEEQYKVSVNIFNKGMNIFYVEDGKKEQKKLLKFRFNKYHSVINDYLSSL